MQRYRSAAMTLVLAGALFLAGSASAATTITDPAGFVRAVYARVAKGGDYAPPEDIYSPRLNTLWAGEQRDAKGEVGRVDFLFWINGQDGQPSKVEVTTSPVFGRPDRQIVVAKFVNEKPQTIDFYFERVGGAWKLDDAVSLTPGYEWTLSVILKYGWPG